MKLLAIGLLAIAALMVKCDRSSSSDKPNVDGCWQLEAVITIFDVANEGYLAADVCKKQLRLGI